MAEQLYAALPKLAGWDQNTSTQLGEQVVFWQKHFDIAAQYLHQLDLTQANGWRASINRNIRRNIRKAEEQLALEKDLSLTDFYALNQLSFSRQNLTPPYSFAQLERHDQALVEQQAREIFGARDQEGRLHSAAYLIWDQQAAYYHLSGDDPTLRASGSGIWLLAHAIDYTQNVL